MRAAAERILPGLARARRQGAGDRLSRTPTTTPPSTHVIAAMRFARQGQSCTAGSRLYVHRDDLRRLHRAARRAPRRLVVGDALDERSDIGSLVSGTQDDRVCGYVDEALAAGRDGAGRRAARRRTAPATSSQPTVLTGVEHRWRVAREEVFGPVLVALPWHDEDEVIALGQRHPLRARRVRVLARPRRAPCAPRTGSRPAGSRSTAAAASSRA